jgi:ATP-binding cassette subfamily B protein
MNMGNGGRGMRGPMRSLSKDTSVTHQHVSNEVKKRIFRFAKPYSNILIIFLTLVVLDAGISVLNPLILREIINRGILDSNVHLIISLAFLVAGLAVIDAGIEFMSRYYSSKIGEGLIYDMRVLVFKHIQDMSLAFFTRTQTGALVSRLNNDVLGAQEAFTDVLSNVVGNIISVLLVLVAMFFLSWQLTLVSLVILPVFLLPARILGRKLHDITLESYNLNATMNNTMIERFNVSGALLSKIYGNPAHENTLFATRAARVRDIGVTQTIYARFLFVALLLTASLATSIIYGWGGVLAVRHILNVGTVVALTAYLVRLYGPLTQLSNINVDVMTALVSFERVFEVLDLKPMVAERPHAKKLRKGPSSIAFDHVSFRYPSPSDVSLASLESVAVIPTAPSRQILKNVSFEILPGELVALVGPSGAGKTTVSQLISRLYDTTSGSVKINNQDVRNVTLASLRGLIGVVTQDAHMFHDTIRQNLLFANQKATDDQMIEAIEQAQLGELLKTLPDGLKTLVGDRGYRLSGGEKQRLAIARVILKHPDIVILDEATAHLDSESERAIQEALQTALKGRTSLVIAHRLSTVTAADKILVLDKGEIVEAGTHKQLIKQSGLYAELYHTQLLG